MNNRDAEQARQLATYIPVDWGAVVGRHLLLPELRAFWPMSAFTESPFNALDLGGGIRTVTNNGGVSRGIYNDLVPYADFDGTNDYFSRTAAADTAISGAMTLGGWLWLDSVAASQILMARYVAGSNQSYFLQYSAGVGARFGVSGNGTTDQAVASSNLTTGAWYHVVGRYMPSTEIAVFVNGAKTTNTTSIPASLFGGSAQFTIGALNGASQFLDGRAALCFLGAAALSDNQILDLYYAARPYFLD